MKTRSSTSRRESPIGRVVQVTFGRGFGLGGGATFGLGATRVFDDEAPVATEEDEVLALIAFAIFDAFPF